jgi:hypothetical protein
MQQNQVKNKDIIYIYMTCSDNTYYAENAENVMYIILIFINAMFMLFTVITTEPFITNHEEYILANNNY